MKRKLTDDDSAKFIGAMQFLEMMWAVKTHYEVDTENGRGIVQVWLPGTEVVLHLESVDVRRIRVIGRSPQRFRDREAP